MTELGQREGLAARRERGIDSLGIGELIALVLREGDEGGPAFGTGRGLVRANGGDPESLATAFPEELAGHPGMDDRRAAALAAAFRLGRLAAAPARPDALRSAADVAAVATRELAGQRRERVIVLVCDAGNRLRRVVTVSQGSIDRCPVPVRETLNAVLRHDGRAFALAHNHPSGDPTPGPEDRRVTRALEAAAGIVGLRFLGHVVVAGDEWRSVREGRRTPG